MQIRTGCPTGCKYISGDRCIANECPYQTGGVHYDIRMTTSFYKTATADEFDDFIAWAIANKYALYHGETIVPVIANAVEKYKIEKGVKSQKPIDT